MPATPLSLRVDARELDLSNAASVVQGLRQAINAAGEYDVEVDISAVSMLDSTAIGQFITLRRYLDEHDGHMALVRVQRRPRRVLEIMELIDILNVTADNATA